MSDADSDTTLQRAQAVDDAGDLKGALTLYSEAVAEQPDNPNTHYFKGRCLFQFKRYEEAIVDLSRAIELQAAFVSAYTFRALARYVTGDHRGAIADNTQVLTLPNLDPEDVLRILYARAMSYRALGEDDLAEQDFAAAKLYDPEGKHDPRGYGH